MTPEAAFTTGEVVGFVAAGVLVVVLVVFCRVNTVDHLFGSVDAS